MNSKNKKYFDYDYWDESKAPSRQKSLFDKEELAKRLAEVLLEQITEGKEE